MTLAQLRNLLRRRIHEITASNWTDSDLNELLNVAYVNICLDVLRVNPQAFLQTYRADILAADAGFLPKPPGFNYETAFKVLDGDGLYQRKERVDYVVGLQRTNAGDVSDVAYSHFGASYFYISPVPTTDLTAGVELDFVPTLSLAADTDVPLLVHGLHEAIFLKAQLLAIGETGEGRKEIQGELDILLNKIPTFYAASGQPDEVSVQMDKGY